MPSLSIVTYPKKILAQRAEEVSLNPDIEKLIPQMIETMYRNEGIGLAAPQIGISKRLIIVETAEEPREVVRKNQNKSKNDEAVAPPQGKPFAFLNPIITKKTGKPVLAEEGCLSLPGIFVLVKRVEEIKLTCQTPGKNRVQIEAKGLIARIFQHEIDHLNGKLIIDHLSLLGKFKLRKQLSELARKSS